MYWFVASTHGCTPPRTPSCCGAVALRAVLHRTSTSGVLPTCLPIQLFSLFISVVFILILTVISLSPGTGQVSRIDELFAYQYPIALELVTSSTCSNEVVHIIATP